MPGGFPVDVYIMMDYRKTRIQISLSVSVNYHIHEAMPIPCQFSRLAPFGAVGASPHPAKPAD